MRNGYNPNILRAWFRSQGIPEPQFETRFDAVRKWRFDMAWTLWTEEKIINVALECNGGLFCGGAHVRGAALLKEHEKLNAAAIAGFRVLFCTPKDLMTQKMADTIKAALGI